MVLVDEANQKLKELYIQREMRLNRRQRRCETVLLSLFIKEPFLKSDDHEI